MEINYSNLLIQNYAYWTKVSVFFKEGTCWRQWCAYLHGFWIFEDQVFLLFLYPKTKTYQISFCLNVEEGYETHYFSWESHQYFNLFHQEMKVMSFLDQCFKSVTLISEGEGYSSLKYSPEKITISYIWAGTLTSEKSPKLCKKRVRLDCFKTLLCLLPENLHRRWHPRSVIKIKIVLSEKELKLVSIHIKKRTQDVIIWN